MAVSDSSEVVIEATPEEILEVIADIESLPEWSSAYQSAEVLETDDDGRPHQAKMTIKTMDITDEQVVEYTWTDDSVSWTLVSANQQRSQDARLTLTPEGDNTRVKFDITVDPHVPLPGFMLKQLIEGMLNTQTDGLRKRVASVKKGSTSVTTGSTSRSTLRRPDRRWYAGIWAMTVKELREVVRDRRTMGILILLPAALLILFGYAAKFNVDKLNVEVMGPGAAQLAQGMAAPLKVTRVDTAATRADAKLELRKAKADVVVVTSDSGPPVALVDGASFFTAQTAVVMLQQVPGLKVEVLFNPALKTSWFLVPSMSGLIISFIGTLVTAMGLVKERQEGTLEQLAVMPFRPADVIIGKITPYFLISMFNVVIMTVLGAVIFGVPFAGNMGVFAVATVIYLLGVLGMGVLISTVSRTQAQAVQTAILVLFPQFMMAGFIFPLSGMPWAVRWVGYLMPLTYYTDISRGVMLRDAPFDALWLEMLVLLGMAVLFVGAAIMAFRRDLAPNVKQAKPQAADRDTSTS